MVTTASPIINEPFLYINGMQVRNNATTPNTKLTVNAGICRDNTNTYDINIGNYLGQGDPSITANSDTVLDTSVHGINGLDAGSLAASTVYNIYVVSDPVSANATGVMASTSDTPLIPFGYSAYRKIGYAITDASVHFLLFYLAGNNNYRQFRYDAPQATAVTAGNATSYTAVALTAFVPTLENTPVSIAYAFTPGAASRVLNITPGNATGNALTVTGQVTSVVISGNATVEARVTSSVPEVDYKVTNSGDAVAINVAGFDYFI